MMSTIAFDRQMARKAQPVESREAPDLRSQFEEQPTYSGGIPFPIRGSAEWDEREYRRRACGCACISLGPLRSGYVRREATDARRLPHARRLRALQRAQRERLRHDPCGGAAS